MLFLLRLLLERCTKMQQRFNRAYPKLLANVCDFVTDLI